MVEGAVKKIVRIPHKKVRKSEIDISRLTNDKYSLKIGQSYGKLAVDVNSKME